jgi:gliding motility-associated-like protein
MCIKIKQKTTADLICLYFNQYICMSVRIQPLYSIPMKRYLSLLFVLSVIGVLPSFSQVKVLCTPPTVFPSADVTICSGQNASISVTNTATTAPYTYQWSPSSDVTCPSCSNTTAAPSTTTTYTMVVTDGLQCTSTPVFVTVTVNPTPTITITGNATLCNGQNTTLTANGGVTYNWQPGGSTTTAITIGPTTGTTYTVTGTGGNGCTSTATQSVTVNSTPTVSISGTATICIGSGTTLSAFGGTTYSWAPGGSTTSAISISPTTGITYTVTGSNGSCAGTATQSVTVNPTPTITISGTATLCNGQNTTLNANGGITYNWQPGGATTSAITIGPTTGTTYTVTGTNGSGCSSTATQSVTVNPLPTANAGTDVSICSGSNTTLNATGNGTFVWSPSTGLSNTTIANPVANPTLSTTYTVTVTNSCGSTTDAVQVSITTTPSVNAGTDATICPGGNTTLLASGSGTYAWTPATGLSNTTIANPVANPTSTTSYTVTITDVCGTASDVVIVNVSTPTATITAPVSICSGSPATLTASGGGTYSWSNGLTTSSIVVSPTSATGYTVTVTNSGGCTDNDNVTVNVNALPTPAISGNTSICSGANTTLTASGGSNYSWNTGVTTTSIVLNPSSTTGYTVTVTDINGCVNSGTVTVNTSAITASITGTNMICIGQNTTLTASGGLTYSWNTGATATTIIVSPTTGTTYTVTASNSIGCTGTSSYSVGITAQPTASVTATTTTICSGSSTSLNASGGAAYVWSPTTGLSNTTISNPTANPTATVTYTVIVSSGTCADTTSILIGVNPVPTATLSATAASICVGGCVTLSASGGISYSWAPGGQTIGTITACPTSASNYTVIATDVNGCTDNATTLINVLPTVSVTVSPNTTICMGTQTTLTAQGGGIYIWNPGGQTASGIVVAPVSSTTYTVVASNGACSDTASVTVNVNPIPTVTAVANPYTINIGNSTTLTGTTSTGTYNWSPVTGLSCAACQNPVASPTTTTTYTLVTVDGNGCSSMDTVIVNVNLECGDIFVPSAFSPNNDGHNDNFRVRIPVQCIKTIHVVIYNRWGQKVFETEDMTQVWDGTIHGKNADPAVFFYIINLELVTNEFKTLEGNVTLVK